MGNRCRCAQQVKYVANTDVSCFGFYFMSKKWTRTKFVIEISLSLQAYWCLPLYRGATGSSAHTLKFSLQSALFSLCMAMRILFSTLSLHVYWCLPLVQRCYRFLCTYPEVLIAIGLILIVHGNENPFQHILVCKFSYLGCQNVKRLILIDIVQLAWMACP